MGISNSKLHTKQQKLKIHNEEYWAKLRVKHDRDGVQYYDMIAGERNRGPHMHAGMTLSGQKLFFLDRNVVTAITKEDESRIYGKYQKEELVLKETSGKCDIVFRVKADGSSQESFVDAFELKSKV